tara:strand:+ start:356 stop:571 length:216 start_codon:yes stop_codon:yes gene_type:complete
MSFLKLLKTEKFDKDQRWIVKWDLEDDTLVREVKQIYNPSEYKKYLSARKLHTQNELIKILENDKEKRKNT